MVISVKKWVTKHWKVTFSSDPPSPELQRKCFFTSTTLGVLLYPVEQKDWIRRKKKISKMTFYSLFVLFVYVPSILCTLKKWRAYGWSNFTSLVREMFLKHMQRTVQVVLLVNVKADGNTPKTLLLSLSFFLKFSSVQENPSNWKLVYTLQQ